MDNTTKHLTQIALMNIQNELKAPKNQMSKSTSFKYKYRSCEDILEALKPLLKKYNSILTINDTLEFIGNRFYIKATAKFKSVDDDELIESNGYAREDENKRHMDASQITGASSSYARKYALNALFLIDDTKDVDSDEYKAKETHSEGDSRANNSEQSKSKGNITQAQINRLYAIADNNNFTEEQVKKSIRKYYNKTSTSELTKKEYDELISKMEKAGAKTNNDN